jgi:hypothetical protein
MGHYFKSRNYHRKPRVQKQDNPELVARIEKTAARGTSVMTDWERNFLGSILDSAKVWGRLTAKQHGIYQNIENRLDPANIAARQSWNDSWNEEKRAAIIFAANYYKANPPYFSDVATRILNDFGYVPGEKLYRKMVENKYVQRAMQHAEAGPLYTVGSMATVRNSESVGGSARMYRGKDVIVLEVEEKVTSAVKGARIYKVLPVGSVTPIETQERFLKKKR